jgi:hypothetical protein
LQNLSVIEADASQRQPVLVFPWENISYRKLTGHPVLYSVSSESNQNHDRSNRAAMPGQVRLTIYVYPDGRNKVANSNLSAAAK